MELNLSVKRDLIDVTWDSNLADAAISIRAHKLILIEK